VYLSAKRKLPQNGGKLEEALDKKGRGYVVENAEGLKQKCAKKGQRQIKRKVVLVKTSSVRVRTSRK